MLNSPVLNRQLVAHFHRKQEEELNVFGACTLEANARPHGVCHMENS